MDETNETAAASETPAVPEAAAPPSEAEPVDAWKKVRKLALKTALSAKQAEGKLMVVEDATLEHGKTAKLAASLGKLGLQSVLVIDGPEVNANFSRAAQNIAGVDVLPQQGANVYDILRRDTLVLTKAGVEALEARLK